jgi:uncharacterized protein YndB with AHSA1/START domain
VTRYDVSNTAVIAATPGEIIGAFLEEAAGRSQWWQPYLRMRQRSGRPLPEIGAAVDIDVAGGGGLTTGWSTRIAGRVAAFEPDQRLVLEYFEGDFRGTEEWTVDPVDAGHTRVTTRWRTDPQGVVRLAARFVDVPGSYSKVMREGFRAIERYTAGRRAQPGG